MVKDTSEIALLPEGNPDLKIKAREMFGIDSDMEVPAFSKRTEHVPAVDEAYIFDPQTTIAILDSRATVAS